MTPIALYGTGIYGTDLYADEPVVIGTANLGIGGLKSVTIRLQGLDGSWTSVGSDTGRGIWPENDEYKADEFGPSTCRFDLHRDPGVIWPDIGAESPIEVEIGGVVVWSGRVSETPTREAEHVVNVQGKGWQYHLDDDTYEYPYVHTKLADYKDLRSYPGATLGAARLLAAGAVNNDNGQIQLAFPIGTTIANQSHVGVALDLGASVAKRVIVEYESSNNSATILLYIRGAAVADPWQAATFLDYEDTSVANSAAATGVLRKTFTAPRRYVQLFMAVDSGGGGATVNEFWFKLKAVRVFTDTAYESGDQSILKGPTIVRDAISRATILLSSDTSQIDPDGAADFNWPEFALDGHKTPREVCNATNAAQDWLLKVGADKRPVFKPRPSTAALEIGPWGGATFDDASMNASEEIHNRVVVEGTGADGQQLRVERSAAQQPGAQTAPAVGVAPGNASFATDTSTWAASGASAITRDTGVFDTSPASGRWDRGAGVALTIGDALTETFTGTFVAGRTYNLTMVLKSTVYEQYIVQFGEGSDLATAALVLTVAFANYTVSWTPSANRSSVTLVLTNQTNSGWVHVDSLSLTVAQPTLIDRRGFRRSHILPVKASLTPTLGEKIADVWLRAHRTTPLKGTVRVEGNGAVREVLTGANFSPERLLLRTGELLRLSDRVDPDTGGFGRDGRIAEVTYTPADNAAVVAIDSRRTSHEALLERLAVVVGSG